MIQTFICCNLKAAGPRCFCIIADCNEFIDKNILYFVIIAISNLLTLVYMY